MTNSSSDTNVPRKAVVVLTDSFPYGGESERAFVEPELWALVRQFGRVYVVPTERKGSMPDSLKLPDGVEIVDCWVDSVYNIHKLLRVAFLPSSIAVSIAGGGKLADNIKIAVLARAMAHELKQWMDAEGLNQAETLFYAFWLDVGAMALSVLKSKTGLKYIVRAHRFDVLSSRAPQLRRRAVAGAERVYAVSEDGALFLRDRYSGVATPIEVRNIGCRKLYKDEVCPMHTADEHRLTVMSISRVEPQKRVELNLDMMKAIAVARPGTQVKWIHLGDGSLFEALRQKVESEVLPANMEVELAGGMENSEVQRRYVNEKIDWTMLLSTSEGLPVSVCESLAYGVPVLATDAGGISEAVTDDSGILFPVDLRPEEMVRAIVPYLDSDERTANLRKSACEMWKERFDADVLRPMFVEEISQL